jgi:oligoendopeptidase F
VMKTFWENQKKFENTQATLLDGEIKKHFFSAQVYKYDDCLNARLYGDSIPTAVYYNLIKQVHENLAPLHRFLKLKQELLKLPKFRYEDVYASAVPSVSKTYSYEEAKKIIADAMKPMGAKYGELLNEAYTKRWIDVYPNKGKESGAYSAGLYGVHPYIKLNYNGNYNALSTFAHELGHSMHSWFSNNKQHSNNSEYATFLAEIASTFNENMLMRQMLKTEQDDLFKLFILDNYLDGVRGTIYRQTLFAEFELAIHNKVESGQKLTADFMDETYLKLTKEYYGADAGVTQVDDYIQCEWSRIPHFYMNYYVFQYSTGLIASLALSDMVLNGGEKDRDRYIEMLSAGGSDFPIAILKKAGVDMTQPEPYKAAFKQFDLMVTEMEQIVARLKKAGKL